MRLTWPKISMIAGAVMVFTGARGRMGAQPGGSATRTFDLIMLFGGAALLLWGFWKRTD